jgi:hypothetical protein
MATKSKKPAKPPRVEVTGVVIHLAYPDGSQRTVTLDPKRTEAIFWSDRAMLEIFAPFYDKIERYTTPDELATRFGDHILQLCKGKDRIKITPEFIKQMWELPNEKGLLMPFGAKTIKCIPNCWDHY